MKLGNWIFGSLLVLACTAVACNAPADGGATVPAPSATPAPKAIAADNKDGEAVKAAVEQLFALAQLGDCGAMSSVIALSHTDTDQDWKRSLRYDSPTERVMADKECARLQVLVADLKAHRFIEFAQEDESEGQWNIWVVELQYNDGNAEQHSFAFLPSGNGYLLGDID
jgi:hypothetical protein